MVWLRFQPVVEQQDSASNQSVESVARNTDSTPAAGLAIDTKEILDFQSWMSEFRGGNREDGFLQQGLQIAEARRSPMLQLIQTNSAAALGAAIGYADYAALPQNIKAMVEEPFTTTGDVQVTAICDHEDHTPQYHVSVYLEDKTRLRIGDEYEARTGLSKLDVPIQGIELDGWAVLDSKVFDVVDGEDADWAHETLPIGNPDPELDFLTGEELGPNPVTTVAGGFVFFFSNEETLAELEQLVHGFDQLPGKYTGSSVIYSEEVQNVQAKGFPIKQIQDSQLQLSINDTTGDKTSLFIRVVFSDKPDAPISKSDLETQINGPVSDALVNYSYDQTSMTATVTEAIYEVSMVSTEYAFTGGGDSVDESDLFDEAVALYQVDVPGDPYNTYDIVGVVFPKIDGVGWAGLGTVGGADSRHWLNGVASSETIIHEFGHNYGLSHSNYWVFNSTNTASTNPVDTSGANEEYGDFWDVMGDGDSTRGHFHMAAKRYLSWLGESQVETIDSDGTYERTIFRFDHENAKSDGLQGLEIKKTNNENYWVGFRRAFESNANYYRGAYILWERPPSGTDRNQGWIIDTTPGSEGERQDAGISLGRTYSDTTAQVHITPIAVGGSSPNEYLDVVVNVGAFTGNSAPTVSITAPATGDARASIAFSATGNDTNGDTLAYSWDLGNGEVYESSDSINASFTVGGTYTVSVTVSDMKGGTMTASEQITISDPLNTWTDRSFGSTKDMFSLAKNGTHVVAGGKSTLLRSTDGETWTNVSPSGMLNVSINSICWTGSEFVAVGQDYDFDVNGWQGVIYTSSDGETWTRDFEASALAGGASNGFVDVACNEEGSLIILVGDRDLVYKQEDGGDWTAVDLGLSVSTRLGIGFGGGVFVVGGFDFTNQLEGLYLFRTSDGVNWTDLEDNSDLNSNAGLDTIAHFNDIFIGSGFNSRVVFSENGGISWQTLQQGNRHDVHAFGFGAGVFYAIGEDEDNADATVNLVSSDGKIWEEVEAEATEEGNAVIFFNNSFIIAGGGRFNNEDDGFIKQSGLVEAADEVLAAPIISPSFGGFSDSVDVTITTDAEGAQIRYTLNGSEPTASSTLYSGAITITETTTVKAKVFKSELDPSVTASRTYTKALEGFAAWIDGFEVGDETVASDNPDGDWANNFFEWAVGSLPNDGDSVPDAPELSFNSLGRAVFTISRFAKSADVTLSIEKSTDMKTWDPLPTTPTTDSATMLVLVSDSAINTFPCFLRIRAKD
ncbi:MAG: chitobiase/beta-hexosaminidase C-terminal domain-containing protein [Verrucomicrobia bacterium]|nr:chitobiase/beta-hexosaminidase C-terminal domain-containing protein [Verrucomicrobiota bacterium]